MSATGNPPAPIDAGSGSTPDHVAPLLAIVRNHAAQRGSDGAIWSKRHGIWASLSWSQLLARVNAVSAGLRAAGVAPAQPVGLLAENVVEWAIADLAIQDVGARSVAVCPREPGAAELLAEQGVRIAFCGAQEHVDALLEASVAGTFARLEVFDATGLDGYEDERLCPLGDFERWDAAEDAPQSSSGLDEVACVSFSAGRDGAPGPVAHDARTVVELGRMAANWLELGPTDRIVSVLPLALPAVRTLDLYAPLIAGARIHFPESAASVPGDLAEVAPTIVVLPPRGFDLLHNSSTLAAARSSRLKRRAYEVAMTRLQGGDLTPDRQRRRLAHLLVGRWVVRRLGLRHARRLVCVGDGPGQTALRYFASLGLPVTLVHGPAEAGGLLFADATLEAADLGGVPLPSCDARVDDDGVLAVRGPAMDGWWRTGQLARAQDDGRIVVLGMPEHLLTGVDGAPVSPAAVERVLVDSQYIANALAVEVDGKIAAVVELDFEPTALWAARARLPIATFGALAGLPATQSLIASEINARNARLPPAARVGFALVLQRRLSHELGELTPELAIRRHVVTERFADALKHTEQLIPVSRDGAESR
jgi:long-chain acyl-CoA synthetase